MPKASIPKTIHYCWFSGKKKPAFIERCIASWHKHCPDYKIKAWTAENFDLQMNVYVAHYAKKKQWAFVSDFARFYILYHEGGIYLDSDVEVLKPFDNLLQYEGFVNFLFIKRKKEQLSSLGAEILGAQKGHPIMKALYEKEEKNFAKKQKMLLNYTVASVFLQHGLKTYGRQNIQGIELLEPHMMGGMQLYNGLDDGYILSYAKEIANKPAHQNLHEFLKSQGNFFPKEMYAFHWSEMTWVTTLKSRNFAAYLNNIKQIMRLKLKEALPLVFQVHVYLRKHVPLYYKIYCRLFPHNSQEDLLGKDFTRRHFE